MHAFSFSLKNKTYSFNPSAPISLVISIRHGGGTTTYGMEKPRFSPFRSGEYVASIKEGGKLNCEQLCFYPHSSGTHTETLLHASSEGLQISEITIPALLPVFVVTVCPEPSGEDFIIKELASDFWQSPAEAVVVRTLPNTPDKQTADYTNRNAPYFTPELMQKLAEKGIKHFLTDLPSVDREQDEGKLLAHKAFFNQRRDATISELLFIPDEVQDGLYLLNLQVPSVATDAVPSRPVLFALTEI